MKKYVVTIETKYEIKHIGVWAESKDDALIRLEDRIPPKHYAKVTVRET